MRKDLIKGFHYIDLYNASSLWHLQDLQINLSSSFNIAKPINKSINVIIASLQVWKNMSDTSLSNYSQKTSLTSGYFKPNQLNNKSNTLGIKSKLKVLNTLNTYVTGKG